MIKLGDTDGDGKLSADEFKQLGKAIGEECPLTDAELKLLVLTADKDGDGLLDAEELKEIMDSD